MSDDRTGLFKEAPISRQVDPQTMSYTIHIIRTSPCRQDKILQSMLLLILCSQDYYSSLLKYGVVK